MVLTMCILLIMKLIENNSFCHLNYNFTCTITTIDKGCNEWLSHRVVNVTPENGTTSCKHAKTVRHNYSYAKRQNNQQLYCWLPDSIYADYGNSDKQAYTSLVL